MPASAIPAISVQAFIRRWESSGAAERANYQLFLTEFCDVLGVPRPEPTRPEDEHNAYVFERAVTFHHGDGTTSTGRIDLYKRGCFVLEAKQGSDQAAEEPFALSAKPRKLRRGTAVRGTQGWDDAMLAARGQAEQYAKELPAEEGWPPFLIVVDVGHAIELFADFSGIGKTYTHFPDVRSYRIGLHELEQEATRELLRRMWTEPLALDPSRRSAKVTREVAAQLAELAKSLEASGHTAEAVANFLMRCIFTMFAEDVELLPKESFTNLLKSLQGECQHFAPMAEELWKEMKTGKPFSAILRAQVLHFNGGLFESATALPLTETQLALLVRAAEKEWSQVEPAIFGTLLERALDPRERHKLGAHFTPRAYVERLVIPTVIEPLRKEWEAVKVAAVTLAKQGQRKEAITEVRTFHHKLCETKVLDPACGSGNFLYVTLEHLKRLEGEINDLAVSFGDQQGVFENLGYTVDPHQLLGIEVNPRAAAITDLVLWIGYLQWHFRTHGQTMPAQPVLKSFHNIECRDAVLAYDRKEPILDEMGQPVTRWDGLTMKKHPVTKLNVPDVSACVPVWKYENPRKANWPNPDFVVGNPPFLGQQRMRVVLGDGYVDALRTANPAVPDTSDYVMYWWNAAATQLLNENTRRFGFVTTNKITQKMNRKVVETFLEGDNSLSVKLGIPDHPWSDDPESAAVRIAMTVVAKERGEGVLLTVVKEKNLEEQWELEFRVEKGHINSDLTIGVDVSTCHELASNIGIAIKGFELGSQGFLVDKPEAEGWLRDDCAIREVLRPYMNGDDLKRGIFDRYVIDFFGLTEQQARKYGQAYQHVYDRVISDRAASRDERLIKNWWLFRRAGTALRLALGGLPRFIGTTRTAKFRVFQFLSKGLCAESKIVVVATNDALHLGVLSSRIHVVFSEKIGGWLGKGNDPTYNHLDCFNKFPFPVCDEAKKTHIRELGEALDSHRKEIQSKNQGLTVTDMYNVLEKLCNGEALTDKEKLIHEQGLVSVLKQIHYDLDQAVFDAYGWPTNLTDEQILERLVALNAERAAEEERGLIRWLRPEVQNLQGVQAETQGELEVPTEAATPAAIKPKQKSPWPKTLAEQAQTVRAALAAFSSPVTAAQLAVSFSRARADRIEELLETLATLGQAREVERGKYVG